MEEKKVLNNEQLEKVSGGMTDWLYEIERRCPICGENWFDTSDASIPVDSPCHPGNTLEVVSVRGFEKIIPT